jgi:hypothetical protein
MKDLPAISRYMHLPEELLRFPVELLIQGYEPNYLATYRPDELGGLDSKTLTRLKRSVLYEASLSDHKEQIAQTLQKDGLWTDVISQVVRQCTSISQVDAIVKNLRGRKTAKAFADSDPNIEKIGQAILLHRGENVQDYQAWVQNQAGISAEDAQVLMPKVKRWLQLLLGEDAQLMLTLQRALIKNAVASVKILPEPSKESESAQVSASESIVDSAEIGQSVEQTSQDSSQQSSTVALSSEVQSDATPLVLEQTQEPATTADAESVLDGNAQPQPSKSEPSIASFQSERKKTREIKTKSLSDKQLSPRQRRRRWLRGILESYASPSESLRHFRS